MAALRVGAAYGSGWTVGPCAGAEGRAAFVGGGVLEGYFLAAPLAVCRAAFDADAPIISVVITLIRLL